ncbi:MAG: PD40 domain-containing protein, partial [Chloroflexia bacterium]|nr:PD40 domain-containing protein [Chloroflexia bacterium]
MMDTDRDTTRGASPDRTTSSVDDDPASPETPAADLEEDAPAVAAVEISDPADRLFESTVILPGSPEASPDGAWLAYLLDDEAGATHLWLSPADGGDAQRIDLPFAPVEERGPDTGRALRGPQWSPDGVAIALSGTHPEGDRLAIWLVPAPVAVPIAGPDPAPEPVPEPPDAPEGEAPLNDADVPEPDPEGVSEAEAEAAQPVLREPRLLVESSGSDRSPRWSPDGTRIAFVSHRDRRDVIALATVDGGESPGRAELLTWGAAHDREP